MGTMSEQFLTPATSQDMPFLFETLSKNPDSKKNCLLGVIYAGENDVAFSVYTAPHLRYLLGVKGDVITHAPQAGWYEQDPDEIIKVIYQCCERACNEIMSLGYVIADIKGVSITNVRETVVVWNALTGRPLYRAIAANDSRAASVADEIISALPTRDQNYYRSLTGLPVLPNFLAVKMQWLLNNVEEVRRAIKGGYCRVGTLDSWIVWNLTKGNLHITDVTNASYTMLMDINTLQWHPQLLTAFGIQKEILPCIRSNSSVFGNITDPTCVLHNKRITGIIADQQGMLLGQMCLYSGKISINLSSNCCLLCNIESKCILPRDAITTVAYKLHDKSSCMYALEGTILGCGKLFDWLQKKVRILPDISSAEALARSVRTTNNVYFVPAFSGLNAPYWRKDARGILVGLSDKTNRLHIVRAALEAICFQIYDILESMRNTGELRQDVVYVAGLHASNELLMQMLADISGLMVVRFNTIDPISYGAAMCAGYAIQLVDMKHVEQGIWRSSMDFTTFVPYTRKEQRIEHYTNWRRAVAQSVNWTKANEKKKAVINADKKFHLLTGTIASILAVTTIVVIVKFLRSKF